MSSKKYMLASLLLGLAVSWIPAMADTGTLQEAKARKQFLDEHPAVAKIIEPDFKKSAIPSIPLQGVKEEQGSIAKIPAGPQRVASKTKFIANMVANESWEGRYRGEGIYSFYAESPVEFTEIHRERGVQMYGNGGGILLGDRYYLTNYDTGMGMCMAYYFVYDANTWELLSSENKVDGTVCATDLAWDSKNNVVYGAFFNENLSGFELCTVDYSGSWPKRTVIGDLPMMVVALGVNGQGEIYGVCEDGVLYKFDSTDATATRIGDTGVKVCGKNGVVQQTGEFDMHTDTFYWAANDVYGNYRLLTVDTTDASVQEVSTFQPRVKLLNMQIMPREADDKAPNSIEDLNVAFVNDAVSGTVSFTVPEDSFDGSPLTGNVSYTVVMNGKEISKGNAVAGQKVEVAVNGEPGEAVFEVWLTNDAGNSPVASEVIWIGNDYPVVDKVDYIADGMNSSVSWSTASLGAHGGYVGDCTFKVVRMPGSVVVAENYSERSFTETLPQNEVSHVYYEITPFFADKQGETVASNAHNVGEALGFPYLNTFDTEEALSIFEVVDGNNDGCTWGWNIKSDNEYTDGVAACMVIGKFPVVLDEWLITPEFKVKAGHSYRLSFIGSNWTYDRNDVVSAYAGQGLDVNKYGRFMEPVKCEPLWTECAGVFTSDKDQVIRFAIRRESDYTTQFCRIDNLEIVDEGSDECPAEVENLLVEPDEEGDLVATVSFTAPSTDQAGNPLASLDRAEIYVGLDRMATIENLVPGQEYECEVEVPTHSVHSFRVDIFGANGQGKSKTVKQFVGQDIPGRIKVQAEDCGDYIVLRWDECVKGVNDRFINPDRITYNAYQFVGVGEYILLGSIKGESELILDFKTNEGPIGKIDLCVQPVNDAGAGSKYGANRLIVGKPYELPYEEHFDNNSGYLYDGDIDWMVFTIGEGISADDDHMRFTWNPFLDDFTQRSISTCKIDISTAENPELSFQYQSQASNKFEVYALLGDGSEVLLGEVTDGFDYPVDDFTEEWLTANIDLSPVKDKGVIRLKLVFIMDETLDENWYVNVDDLVIIDKADHNLRASIKTPANKPKYGDRPTIVANVKNFGHETSSEYKVNMYVNGVLVGTQTGSGVEFKRSAVHPFTFELKSDCPEKTEVKAEVVYDLDEIPEDNIATATLDVQLPKVSAPEDLVGDDAGGVVKLEWKAPTEFYEEDVVEDWESYLPWSIQGFGDWTLIDVDGGHVITLDQAEFPNEGTPQAFTIFNPGSIGLPEGNPEGFPHSGYQYLCCFAADINEVEHNDDWIISPLLTGEAQTIEFFAKQMTDYYGPEYLQVLVSKTGKAIEDFELVKEYEITNWQNWGRFELDLPEGSLWFAFRVITRDGHLCMIDDVKFRAGSCKEITGWRVYRDLDMIAEVPAGQLNFTDNGGSRFNRYNVTAVYKTGEESGLSNDAQFISGVEDINAGKTTYTVYSIDGKVLLLNAESLGELEPGVYIINGQKTLIK